MSAWVGARLPARRGAVKIDDDCDARDGRSSLLLKCCDARAAEARAAS
jgi:hypothetical protein